MSRAPPSARRKWLLRALKLSIVVLLVWAVRRTLADAWHQLDQQRWQLQPAWLVAAGVLYLAGLLPAGFFWYRLLRAMGQAARLGESLRAYFIGHLGKYVPGKAMVVVIRSGLVAGPEVNAVVAAMAVFFETMTMMAVGAFLSAAILAAWFRDRQDLFYVAVGMTVVSVLSTFPPVVRGLIRLTRIAKLHPAACEALDRLRFRTLMEGWVLMAIGWVILGMSLWAVLRAMGVPEPNPLAQWPRLTASVSLATVAGVLSLIPGGAIVRDLVLAQLMAPYFKGSASALFASKAEIAAIGSAVLWRIVSLVSELVVSGILYFGGAKRERVEKGIRD